MTYGTIEFRICDAQRSLKKVEMLTAICQALVYQSTEDIKANTLTEIFNYEYLQDALWKSIRFPFDVKIIDPETNNITTMYEQILKMKSYIQEGLENFNNKNINKEIDNILKNGTECDEQNKIYEQSGFDSLKKYLINTVDYDYKD